MKALTAQQAAALKAVVEGVIEAVKAGGAMGAPGGVLYMALMASGCTYAQFESLMAGLVEIGKLEKKGECYFLAA